MNERVTEALEGFDKHLLVAALNAVLTETREMDNVARQMGEPVLTVAATTVRAAITDALKGVSA